ncbi:phosphopyruvate hydratase [Candidatus Micrarchaeota archaeon]|nr:phosphopyruvate hydratase [Candidatus Micrarchaeota archaeon]
MGVILSIKAREVLDSRGNPTIEAEVCTKEGLFRSMVPSGASTGEKEALELRDGGSRYGGKGVLKAVENVNKTIAPRLIGLNPENQADIDAFMIELDGTATKSRLGANAILSVSMAVAQAGACSKGVPLYQHLAELADNKNRILPTPQLNVMNGGKHAGREEDIQELMLAPLHFTSYKEALRASVEAYYVLGGLLKKKYGAQGTLLGDEGGFVPPVNSAQERMDLMLKAIEEAGYGGKIELAVDSASSEFYENGVYKLYGKAYSSAELVDYYTELVEVYPIYSWEDGMAENDWVGWKGLTSKLGSKIQIVGDDVLVTNTQFIKQAISEKACNALLLKFNQIGSVSEGIGAANLSFKAGWGVVESHRSGETEDSFIADAVVGLGAGQSKFGGPARSSRNAKYNQLLRIEEALGSKARYAGKNFRKGGN